MEDGNVGVFQRGVQAGSAVSSGLTPLAPSRITVTGRTLLYVYLTYQASIPASARAMSTTANARADCSRSAPVFRAATSVIWLQCPGGSNVPGRSD
jgi:hypothetical protein